MKKAQTYNSELIDDLLNEITPREQKRTENRMRLAAKIADGLKAKGWSKQRFAEELGYKSSSIVTKWLSGTNNFTSDVLSDIQDVLEIKLLALEDKRPSIEQRDVYEKRDVVVVLNSKVPAVASIWDWESDSVKPSCTVPSGQMVDNAYVN